MLHCVQALQARSGGVEKKFIRSVVFYFRARFSRASGPGRDAEVRAGYMPPVPLLLRASIGCGVNFECVRS